MEYPSRLFRHDAASKVFEVDRSALERHAPTGLHRPPPFDMIVSIKSDRTGQITRFVADGVERDGSGGIVKWCLRVMLETVDRIPSVAGYRMHLYNR